jgi:hypothetical protein
MAKFGATVNALCPIIAKSKSENRPVRFEPKCASGDSVFSELGGVPIERKAAGVFAKHGQPSFVEPDTSTVPT